MKADVVVDVMRVPASGPLDQALVSVDGHDEPISIMCDVLVVGGGTGGVAAALAAARRGCSVCLIEETDWIGGQMTSQGVSALDEHDHIEAFGGTESYYTLRRAMRSYYRALAVDAPENLNPGNCWVTRVAFEPRICTRYLTSCLADTGLVKTFLRTRLVTAEVNGDRIVSATAISLVGRDCWRFDAKFVLDATELGDILPLAGVEYRLGAETIAETAEPHAQPEEAKPHCVQSFTYVFALERRPAHEQNWISPVATYTHFRRRQPYELTIQVHGGEIYAEESGLLAYDLFKTMPGTKGGLWTYRRLVDAAQFPDRYAADLTIINWPGNDYRDASIIDSSPHEVAVALQAAKQVSLGFLYWLQTEAPADGRIGAPELLIRPDVMGSDDGLSKYPYIRESRRIVGLTTIVEQDVSVELRDGPRARHFDDSVGVGWYPIDIHSVAGDVGVSCRTWPFQIPLGALIPVRVRNLLAAGKNIGTTHITNGCYRVHPVEWNVGESAGAVAAFCIQKDIAPKDVRASPTHLCSLQNTLLEEGIPISWITDVPASHPAFGAVQRLFMRRLFCKSKHLYFEPDAPVCGSDWNEWGGGNQTVPATRAAAALLLDQIHPTPEE